MNARVALCRLALSVALLFAAANPAGADEFDTGEFVVHYTALSTMQLTPEIAAQYGIARSPNRGLLNVAVVRKQKGTTGIPVAARVTVIAVTAAGLYLPVAMRRIDEPPSIYAIGELTVADVDTVDFELTVTPEGSPTPIVLRLQHQFFAR